MNKDLKAVYNCLTLYMLYLCSLILSFLNVILYYITKEFFFLFFTLAFFLLALYINHGVVDKKERKYGLA